MTACLRTKVPYLIWRTQGSVSEWEEMPPGASPQDSVAQRVLSFPFAFPIFIYFTYVFWGEVCTYGV